MSEVGGLAILYYNEEKVVSSRPAVEEGGNKQVMEAGRRKNLETTIIIRVNNYVHRVYSSCWHHCFAGLVMFQSSIELL